MRSRSFWRMTIAAAGLATLVATSAVAQTTTTSTAVRPFEVISVVGNQLVVKGPDGTREYTVPEDFRFTVDGKQLSVHQLKVGMKGEAAVTTITTSKPVQVVEERNVKVMQAFGNSVIIRATDGTFKLVTQQDIDKYKIQITRNGQPIDFQQLKAQQIISAVFITEKMQTLTEQQVNARLAANPPPPEPAAASPPPAASKMATPPATAKPAPPPAAASPAPAASPMAAPTMAPLAPAAPKTLPKTASPLPIAALVGGLFLAVGAALTVIRRRRTT